MSKSRSTDDRIKMNFLMAQVSQVYFREKVAPSECSFFSSLSKSKEMTAAQKTRGFKTSGLPLCERRRQRFKKVKSLAQICATNE